MKQTISNACGTVAMIHAVANNLDRIELDDSGTNKDANAGHYPRAAGQFYLGKDSTRTTKLLISHNLKSALMLAGNGLHLQPRFLE